MTLHEAFHTLGPIDGTPDDLRREAAAAVVSAELARQARRLTSFQGDHQDDAVQSVLFNLVVGGNRSESARACDTDGRVVGYLYNALRYALIDQTRRGKRLRPFDLQVHERPKSSGVDSPEGEAVAAQTLAIRERFFAEVVPRCAEATYTRERPRADFIVAVAQMRRLATDAIGIEELRAEIARTTGRPVEENTLHKRHSRARRDLEDYVRRLRRDGDIALDVAAEYEACVSFLQRRASSAREAARAARRREP